MSMTVDGAGQSRARNRSSASPPRLRACVRDQSVDDGGLPYRWRHSCIALAHPVARAGRRDCPGMAALAERVSVALAAARGGWGAAASTHSLIAALHGSCLLAGRVVEVGLHRGFCASEPAGDLGDPEALLVAVVARECDGPTTLLDAVRSHHASDDTDDCRRHPETRNPQLVLAAARELPQVALDDTLRICLVRDSDADRDGRAAVRGLALNGGCS